MKCTLSICVTLLVLFQQQQFVCGQLQCGTVGRVGSTRTDDRNRAENEFYINRGNRAECAGMITSISYCFHRPPSNLPLANEYLATVAVYTPASSDDNEGMFTVSSSPIVIQKSANDLIIELNTATDPNFACSELSLPEPVSVAVGDVLGACLFEPPDDPGIFRYRLDLVSRAASGSEDLVRTATHSSNPAGCSATSVPSLFDLSDSDKRTSASRSLHLWANIAVPPTVPMDPPTNPPTDPTTEPTDIFTELTDPPSVTNPLITDNPDSPTTQLETGDTTAQLVTGDTTALPISGGGGSTAAVAIAVVIVLLVVIVISVILVVAIVLLTKNRENVKKSYTMNTNNSVGEQMIDVKLNEAYGTRNEVTRDTTTEAVFYDVIDETGQKEPEEPIPTDTNAAYHSHSVNNTTTEAPEYYDVLANPYEAVPVGEVDMPMEENTAYASNALDNDQETTDYDYVLRQ